jgi:hypothetical protein
MREFLEWPTQTNSKMANRDLLYVVMLSGDGNFHLQSYSRVNGPHINPSVFGDFGFWVPYETAKKYTEWADSQQGAADVSLIRQLLSS